MRGAREHFLAPTRSRSVALAHLRSRGGHRTDPGVLLGRTGAAGAAAGLAAAGAHVQRGRDGVQQRAHRGARARHPGDSATNRRGERDLPGPRGAGERAGADDRRHRGEHREHGRADQGCAAGADQGGQEPEGGEEQDDLPRNCHRRRAHRAHPLFAPVS